MSRLTCMIIQIKYHLRLFAFLGFKKKKILKPWFRKILYSTVLIRRSRGCYCQFTMLKERGKHLIKKKWVLLHFKNTVTFIEVLAVMNTAHLPLYKYSYKSVVESYFTMVGLRIFFFFKSEKAKSPERAGLKIFV